MSVEILLSNNGRNYSATFSGTTVLYSDYMLREKCIPRTQLDCTSRHGGSFTASFDGLTYAQANEISSYRYLMISKDGVTLWLGYLDTVNRTVHNEDDIGLDCTYGDRLTMYNDRLFCEDPASAYANHDQYARKNYTYEETSSAVDYYTKTADKFLELRDNYCYAEGDTKDGKVLLDNSQVWYTCNSKYLEYQQKARDYNVSNHAGYSWYRDFKGEDGYVVCDPYHRNVSMVHIILSYIPEFNVECDYFDLTPIKYMYFKGNEKVVDVLMDFLQQNGMGICVEANTIRVIGFSALFDTTATVIQDIEREVKISEKPYIEYKFPRIRYAPTFLVYDKVASLLKHEEDVTGVIDKIGLFFNKYLSGAETEYCIWFKGKWLISDSHRTYPMENQIGTCDKDTSKKIYEPAIGNLQLTDGDDEYFDYADVIVNKIEQVVSTSDEYGDETYPANRGKYGKGNGTDPTVHVSYGELNGTSFDYRFDWDGRDTGGADGWFGVPWGYIENFDVYTTITRCNYTNDFDGKYPDMKAEYSKCRFIWDDEHADLYDQIRIWEQDCKKKSYTFYTPDDLRVGQVVYLEGVDNNALMILSKEMNIDEWGGGTYVAVSIPRQSEVVIPSTARKLEDDTSASMGMVFQPTLTLSRPYIPAEADGTPKDTTPCHITFQCPIGTSASAVTLKIGNTFYEMTRVSVEIEDEVCYTGEFTYDFDVTSGVWDRLIVKATYAGSEFEDKIDKLKDGTVGQDGSYMQYQYAIGTRTSYPTSENSWSDSPPERELATGEYIWQRQRRVQP